MNVNFYKCQDDRAKVDKTLSDEKTVQAFSNTVMDIVNPVLKITTKQNLDGYNMIYIPILKRYYFIENVTLIRKGLYQINLHIDVIYTYREKIRASKGRIGETEKEVEPYYEGLNISSDIRPQLKKIDFDYTFPDVPVNVVVAVNDRGKS